MNLMANCMKNIAEGLGVTIYEVFCIDGRRG